MTANNSMEPQNKLTPEDKKLRWALPQNTPRGKAGDACTIPGCSKALLRTWQDGRLVCGECRFAIKMGLLEVRGEGWAV